MRDRRRAEVSNAAFIWDPGLADYDLGPHHPLNPLRLKLTVDLLDAYGVFSHCETLAPHEASERQIALVHSRGYIETVVESSDWGAGLHAGSGLGTEDNPIYPGMHTIAALTCGASILGLEEVLSGRRTKAFSIAGGMHHAHRSRAAGFSVYNDAAVAIAVASEANPSLKVLYVDIDAHHGDGVQEAFFGRPEVMTISLHESGLHAFPGTGFPLESGYGEGEGTAVNVPMPPLATDECYRLAFDEVVAPLVRAFAPDVIVAQLGVDAHYADPLTDLAMTLPGYRDIVRRIMALSEELCAGRLLAIGGGGYHVVEVVPRAWTWVMAELIGIELDDRLPERWREHVCETTGTCDPPTSLGATDRFDLPEDQATAALEQTAVAIEEVRAAVFTRNGLGV